MQGTTARLIDLFMESQMNRLPYRFDRFDRPPPFTDKKDGFKDGFKEEAK